MYHQEKLIRQPEWTKQLLPGHSVVSSTKTLSPAPRAKTDSRLIKLKLTAKGKQTFSQIEESALAWERELVRNVKLSELNNLYTILNKIDANLDRLDKN